MVVRAGGKNDPDDATGLAHYLEHLLFKGTRELGTTNYPKEKIHLERITQLYEQHFLETNPENREAIYAQINAESQLAAQYAIPNEINRLYQSISSKYENASTGEDYTFYMVRNKIKIDLEDLAKYGKITEISLDQIFAF